MPTTRCKAITSFRGLMAEERWTITYKCYVKNVTTIKVINDNHCRRSISGSFFEKIRPFQTYDKAILNTSQK